MGLMRRVVSIDSSETLAINTQENHLSSFSSSMDSSSKKRSLIHQKASLCKYQQQEEHLLREVVVLPPSSSISPSFVDNRRKRSEREERKEEIEEKREESQEEEVDENIAVKQSLISSSSQEDQERRKEERERKIEEKERKTEEEKKGGISPVPSIEEPVQETKRRGKIRSSGIFPSRFMSSKVRKKECTSSSPGTKKEVERKEEKKEESVRLKQQSESMQESPREYSELTTTLDYDELKSSTLSTDEDELMLHQRFDPHPSSSSHSGALTVIGSNLNRAKSLQLPEPDPEIVERGLLRQTLSDSKPDNSDWDLPHTDDTTRILPSKDDEDGKDSKSDCT